MDERRLAGSSGNEIANADNSAVDFVNLKPSSIVEKIFAKRDGAPQKTKRG